MCRPGDGCTKDGYPKPGAFGGNARLKTLLQLMACGVAARAMTYYTFADKELRDDTRKVYNLNVGSHITVGKPYKYIIEFCESDVTRTNLYEYLEETIQKRH